MIPCFYLFTRKHNGYVLYLELLNNKLSVTTTFPSDWIRIVNNTTPDGPAFIAMHFSLSPIQSTPNQILIDSGYS
jgi:hypothetical protein